VYLLILIAVSDMEMEREADSNDITECSLDESPPIGKIMCLLHCNHLHLCNAVIFSQETFYRAMLCRAWLCLCMSSVHLLFVCDVEVQ